jgi:putative membrane protein
MNRRNALLALTGAVATTALIRPAQAQMPAAGTPPVTRLDASQYHMQTLMVGTASKAMSALAIQRTEDPRVRQFAQFEVDEQTAMAQVLTDMTAPPPAPLDQTLSAMLQGLQAESGPAFDRAYVAHEIQGHNQLLAIQQGYLNLPPDSRDLEHIAILARTVIMMHLTMLDTLQGLMVAG